MELLNRIKNGQQELAKEAITNTSLDATMTAFEQIRESGGLPFTYKLDPAPNDIDPKMFYEGVRDKTAELIENAPRAYAGRLLLNRELTDERSLTPVGLGAQGWLWDVVPEGGTLVFTNE